MWDYNRLLIGKNKRKFLVEHGTKQWKDPGSEIITLAYVL